MKIFGAGLSGLIAGGYFPKAVLFEKNKEPVLNHHAVLRFRTDDVSKMTGIKFRKVSVIKSIWSEGQERVASPRLVALYSKKVIDCYENRSIMDITTKERFIAPNNFHELLVEECIDRINFNYELDRDDFKFLNETKISTLPLSFNAKMLDYNFSVKNSIGHIYINRFEIVNCDMFATVYYPDISTPIYRASLTGNTLIIESKRIIESPDIAIVLESLGLTGASLDEKMVNNKQIVGKLSEINDGERRVQLFRMSHDNNMFSLGRLALHKPKLLLDDIPHDLMVINDMIKDDTYGVSIRGRA